MIVYYLRRMVDFGEQFEKVVLDSEWWCEEVLCGEEEVQCGLVGSVGNEVEDWDSVRRLVEVEVCRCWEGLEYGVRDVVVCVVDQCINVGMI